jgi:hypothetical protein
MDKLRLLAQRIRENLDDLEQVVDRIAAGWQRARQTNDDYYLDSVALNLHGFYSGIERIFELVGENVDGKLPQGENWHQLLLQQMAQEVPGTRPALISEKVYRQLSEFRGFRHIVRNVYTYNFDPAKMEKLVDSTPQVFAALRAELYAFASFLEHKSNQV